MSIILLSRAIKLSSLCARNKFHPISLRNSATLSKEIERLTPRARKWVGGWLLTCSGMAFGTVVIGGITRITRSGLSMVDWHLFKEFPPLSAEQWQAEFSKYQQFPEFKISNFDMTIEEFKKIWWMEYIHRMMGRTVGAVFLIPAGIFWYKKWFVKSMKPRVLLFGALLLTQGLLGWYMVKSGLEDSTAERYSDPRVSHYRLAAHLGTAFVFYSLLLSTGLSHLIPPFQPMFPITKSLMRYKQMAIVTGSLVFVTAISGAFVAGLDAGLVYNTYPLMGNSLIPSDLLAREPKWKNFLENPTTTQFDHRLLGHLAFAGAAGCWLFSRRLDALPPRAKLAATVLFCAAMMQVTLGIGTLLMEVPKPMASIHQAGALGLLSTALWLIHELKLLHRFPK